VDIPFVKWINDPFPKPKTIEDSCQRRSAPACGSTTKPKTPPAFTAIFKDPKILAISRYPETGQEIHGKPSGSVMTVAFELNGQSFTALNGGPIFKVNEAVSFQIECATQEEVDYYWDRLSEGGDPQAQQCGWLKDKFGLSWQIVPKVLPELLNDPDSAKSQRAFQAMMQMK
jgi:predicted 3-demethylubiquinone-9 3-methyltransferase (glyoxalase superfamily)